MEGRPTSARMSVKGQKRRFEPQLATSGFIESSDMSRAARLIPSTVRSSRACGSSRNQPATTRRRFIRRWEKPRRPACCGSFSGRGGNPRPPSAWNDRGRQPSVSFVNPSRFCQSVLPWPEPCNTHRPHWASNRWSVRHRSTRCRFCSCRRFCKTAAMCRWKANIRARALSPT
jgi:hypothetical protein